MARSRLKERALARADLERSVELLPTAVAYHELGRIAENARDVDGALRYYRVAAQSESSVGALANARIVALDVARNPSAYVRTEVGVMDGRPALMVANLTSVALENIVVRVQLQWADGRIDEGTRQVERLDGGQQVVLALPRREALTDGRPVALAGGRAVTVEANPARTEAK
jgi:hypothetical protein